MAEAAPLISALDHLYLGHGVGGSALVQKQERHLLVVVVRCHMKGREAVLEERSHTVVLMLRDRRKKL